MAFATTPTLLSLDRYATIMGINPLGFNGARSSIVFPSGTSQCSDVWFQHSWQHSDQVAREDLARAIASAERDIANVVGWWPAPNWMKTETVRYPQYHRRDLFSTGLRNVRSQRKAVKLRWGKFIQGGERASELQSVVVPAFSDVDPVPDGFNETVTVTANNIDEDAVLCEVKVYHTGFEGAPEYEIRPFRTATLVGNTFTATFWAWQFFNPALLNEIPISGFSALDADAAGNYVATVEVRWTYNKYADSHGTLFWENDPEGLVQCTVCNGLGCEACSFTTQDLCIHVRDTDLGFAVITPAFYDETYGVWSDAEPAVGRDPDQATVNYYAGNQSDRYLAGWDCDPLEHYLAEAIAYLATARLERPYCTCGVITATARDLRRDLSITSTKDIGYFTGDEVHDNPFGTRLGELLAWRRIKHLADEAVNVGVSV